MSDDKHMEALARFSGVREMPGERQETISAPPRNCDRFATLGEAVLASGLATAEAPSLTGMGNAQLVAFAKWLFAPAAEREGGAE